MMENIFFRGAIGKFSTAVLLGGKKKYFSGKNFETGAEKWLGVFFGKNRINFQSWV